MRDRRVVQAAVMVLCAFPVGRSWGQATQNPTGRATGDVRAAGARAAEDGPDWREQEAGLLTGHVQLTSRDEFVKAGEQYLSADGSWLVFQAVPVPPDGENGGENGGGDPSPHYSMYVARVVRDDSGFAIGLDKPIRISPEGSANTCGWFHPTEPWRVMFGSTLVPPSAEQKSGFQVGTRKYVWMFPAEMDVVEVSVPGIELAMGRPIHAMPGALEVKPPRVLFSRANYDAECSYSRDGRFVLYAHVREEEDANDRPDADVWVYDTQTGQHHALVTADGYDGGPFFSPCERYICYRSDRKGDDLLQLFVAELERDAAGVPVGIRREAQITDDSAVNWAPYWHPSGSCIVYGSSAVGHYNYEVLATEWSFEKPAAELRRRRVTFAPGADVLPVFSADGREMVWTGQRGPLGPGEQRPSSQVWIARVVPGVFDDAEKLFAAEHLFVGAAPDASHGPSSPAGAPAGGGRPPAK